MQPSTCTRKGLRNLLRLDKNNPRQLQSSSARYLAHQLAENFRKEDLEISVIAAGMSNDTLVLSSDLFKESADRTAVMRQLRVEWQDLLCKEGFKTVSLTESGVLSSLHDFALRCPNTEQDRADLAAGLQSDFRSFDKSAVVFASGDNNEVLSMVMTSDAYKTAGNRSIFFQGLKQKGLVRNFCSDGFKELRVYYLTKKSKPSRFPLICSFSD